MPSHRTHRVWPVAFAVLLVANMMSPAGSGIPRERARRPQNALAPEAEASQTRIDAPSLNGAIRSDASDAVAIRPVEARAIKAGYTLPEFLSAVAASSAPFRNTGGALLQMYTLVTGNAVSADTRQSVAQWTQALDFATGLIPDVGLSRIPGEAAGIAADSIEGREVGVERLTSVVQSADPRNWQSRGIVRERPDWREMHKHRYPERHDARTQRTPPEAKADHAKASLEKPVGVALASQPENDVMPSRIPSWRIEGEHEHLQGYAQTWLREHLPADADSRLILIDGKHYLRGEAGYYRATRGHSVDHWLISAPRGGDHAAQVPVLFDPVTGTWHAEKPLRLCGGGCGSSREASPDSIAIDREKIINALAHLHDEHMRDGIRYAFNDLSMLHLTRSNRPDLHMTRDNSIIDHRAALRVSMKRIKRNMPLLKQQEEASLITTMHYYWNHYSEAFCQENSEILFHYLLANDIPTDRIRMITVQPKNRPPHVLVLYTESERLIGLLEAATPQPPLNFEPDGINDMLFAREVYESRDSTVLLDPWSRARATSFAHANHAVDLVDTLDAAFADIGHRPGSMYRVSITRPLGTRRGSSISLGSAGSSRSGSSGGLSSGTSGSTSWSSVPGQTPGAANGPAAGDVSKDSGTHVIV
ncbi:MULTISPECIES: hypothetical protein [Pandoraea]|uniref:hypothetical protein n=1 Tax=Pandoraea TaxID=93217 RepID=UPI001F5D30D0|nr:MULTISPECIES: hypothetical protein [Pandoraea]